MYSFEGLCTTNMLDSYVCRKYLGRTFEQSLFRLGVDLNSGSNMTPTDGCMAKYSCKKLKGVCKWG